MNYDHIRFNLRALLFEWLRRPEQALAAYVECFRADPQDVRAARAAAWIHAQARRWPAAAQWFEKALALEAEHADTWFNLGYVLEQSGDLAAAERALARAVELNPRHDRAWYGMGMLRARRGEHAAAAEALRHAADLQPMNGAAWYALGMAYHHAHDPDQVRRVVEHCASHEPRTAKRLIADAERPDLTHLLPF